MRDFSSAPRYGKVGKGDLLAPLKQPCRVLAREEVVRECCPILTGGGATHLWASMATS
jgi:hypothetical protein